MADSGDIFRLHFLQLFVLCNIAQHADLAHMLAFDLNRRDRNQVSMPILQVHLFNTLLGRVGACHKFFQDRGNDFPSAVTGFHVHAHQLHHFLRCLVYNQQLPCFTGNHNRFRGGSQYRLKPIFTYFSFEVKQRIGHCQQRLPGERVQKPDLRFLETVRT